MAFATSYHTPSPKVLGKAGGRRKAGGSVKRVKTATKTPLSTLLKKASENRVLRDAKLVSMCNHVLASAGLVATVRTPNDVRAVCASTSVLIASYEAVVGEKIAGIIRRPANVEERARNCDLIIQRLQENVLGTDLKHISGQRITQGNLQDTYDLLEILAALGEKWTFATPIKTPSSKRHFGAALTSTTARKKRENAARGAPLPSSLKKKLLLEDVEDVSHKSNGSTEKSGRNSKGATTTLVTPPTDNRTFLDSDGDGEGEDDGSSGKTLKEKLQDLLVQTVEQKQKSLRQKATTTAQDHHRNHSVRFEGYHDPSDEEQEEEEEEERRRGGTHKQAKGKVSSGRGAGAGTKSAATTTGGALAKKKKFALAATKSKAHHHKNISRGSGGGNKAAAAAATGSAPSGRTRGDVREMAEMLLVHDKVGQYVEFDRAIRKLAEMKMSSTRLNHRQFAMEEKKVVDSEKRMRLMRHLWLKSQRAQHRHQNFIEEKRHASSQRSLLHSARVESIKARRFQQRVEELRTSHESRYESAEVQVFRNVFNKAVEVEKDLILENRKQQSRALKENNEATKLRSLTIAREEKLRKHFEDLTEQFKQELLQQRRLEREDDLIKRMYEREERDRITEEREKAMEHLAPFRSGAFDTIAIKGNQVDSMKVGVKHYMKKVSAMVS